MAHDSKGHPQSSGDTAIVEAFGSRKCSKLIEQVASKSLIIRRNALSVLCNEMHNPTSVQGCCEAGMVTILNTYISSSDDEGTRERSSQALVTAAMDAIGREFMLRNSTASIIAAALDDSNVLVRSNVYEALLNFSRGPSPYLKSIIAAKYASMLVAKSANEVSEVQPLVLRLLYNCIKDETGMEDALSAHAVEVTIRLLGATVPTTVQKEAAATLGFLCFADTAKMEAIKGGAVEALTGVLSSGHVDIQAAAVGALMVITTTDEAKTLILSAGGIAPIIHLLTVKSSRLLLLNVLKTIANVAVNPAVRDILKTSEIVLPNLANLEEEADPLIAKHAATARSAVLWTP